MIVKIDWTVDEDEAFTLDDVLGDFRLVLGRVSLGSETTCVDGWLAALVMLRAALEKYTEARVELVDEPVELRGIRQDDSLRISFSTVSAEHVPIADFDEALRSACAAFVKYAQSHGNTEGGTEEFDTIVEFVSRSVA